MVLELHNHRQCLLEGFNGCVDSLYPYLVLLCGMFLALAIRQSIPFVLDRCEVNQQASDDVDRSMHQYMAK